MPLLKTGVTLASFHSSGKIPIEMDVLKITVMEVEITLELILRSLLEMLSRPAAFVSESLLYNRWKTFDVVVDLLVKRFSGVSK